MTPEQQTRLQAAVTEINAAMNDILDTDGSSVIVYPRTRYSMDDGIAEIQVEITTGRVLISAAVVS